MILINTNKVNLNNFKKKFYNEKFIIPLLPSGSIFSTFNASIFWINFSVAHAFLNKTN